MVAFLFLEHQVLYSLRASSPLGRYREKYSHERHARGDATDVLTCLLNLILFAISIHTPKISRQSFRYVAFRDEQTVHLTLFLKKGKCMVFKPRQVQDARIVKFKEIFIQHHDCSSIKETIFVGVILDENCGIPTTRTSRNWNFAIRLVIFPCFSYNSNTLTLTLTLTPTPKFNNWKKRNLWTRSTLFGGFLCRHLTTNVVILERDGDRRNTYVLNVYNTFSQISLLSRCHD